VALAVFKVGKMTTAKKRSLHSYLLDCRIEDKDMTATEAGVRMVNPMLTASNYGVLDVTIEVLCEIYLPKVIKINLHVLLLIRPWKTWLTHLMNAEPRVAWAERAAIAKLRRAKRNVEFVRKVHLPCAIRFMVIPNKTSSDQINVSR
jgi:hypothetical protein